MPVRGNAKYPQTNRCRSTAVAARRRAVSEDGPNRLKPKTVIGGTDPMLIKNISIKTIVGITAAAVALSLGAGVASAYDGTKCKAAGVCWEPKPGYPDKVAGS